jgi:hypothetical protein
LTDKDKPKKKKKVNWPEYNESLVRRGEIMFDTDFLANWRAAELKTMNKAKEGAKYRYPNSLIWLLLATVHAYLLPYRQLEGFLRAISVHIDSLIVPDYTTMWWRVTRIKVSLDPLVDPEGGDIVIAAVDSTGIKVSNRGGEWIRDRWKKKRRGFIKIHVAVVDVRTKKILSMRVTKEEDVSDGSRMLKPVVVKQLNADKVIDDGAYDYNNDNFRFLAKSGIEPVIKVRSNSSTTKANGCKPRKLVVIEQLADVKHWKKKHSYGMRWMAESVFSSIKRMFGEYITYVKWKNMVNELMLRASIYNMFIDAAAQ